MTTLGIDLCWDDLDDDMEDELDPVSSEDTLPDDLYDALAEEDEEIYCKQCGTLVEDGFKCDICGWLVEQIV